MIQALDRPATTARATKSCSLMPSVSPRTWRANRGHKSSAMTRITLRKLGSDTATSTTAIRIVGSESAMSVSRMRNASVRPPRYPEMSPTSVPSVPETPMAIRETSSEMRLPWMIRLSTSRPKRSVPSGCSDVPRSIHRGGMSLAVMSPSVGLCGDRYGAKTAQTTSTPRMVSGNHGRSWLRTSMADPRIEIAVEHVDEEVADQIERAEHEDPGLHDRIVAGGDALEDQPAEAGPREHGLGDHRPAQELHEQQDRERDDRQERVLEPVLPQDDPLGEPLEPRELDVVGVEHLQHRRAREAQDGRRGEIAQREGGQDQAGEAVASAGGEQTQHHREEQDQHEAEPERGHRLPEDGEDPGPGVESAPSTHGRVHAEWHAEEHAHDHRHEPQLDGGGHALPDVLGDRTPG